MPSLEHPSTGNDANNPANNNNDGNNNQKQQRPRAAIVFSSSIFSSSSSHLPLVANINNRGDVRSFEDFGPLVDDGAPYSAIGEIELGIISSRLIFPSPPCESKPHDIQDFDL